MIGFLGRRLLTLGLTLWLASLVVFVVLEVLPGDPALLMLGVDARPDTLAALRAQMGLDQPAPVRYLAWVGGLLTGDLGISHTYGVPVAELIRDRLVVTAPLAALAMLVSTAVALPLGLLAASKRNRPADYGVMAFSQLGVAVPNFWFGILLVLWFSVGLGWFEAGGFPGWSAGIGPALKSLTLPAVTLGLTEAAILARVTRSAVLDTLGEDYVRTARAKGLSRGAVMRRHVLRNALIPITTIVGLQFAFLLGGAIVVENVFFLPGLGRLLFQAISQRDLIVVKDAVMVLAAMVVAVNLIVDILYAVIDPRPKSGFLMREHSPIHANLIAGAALTLLLVGIALVSLVWTPYPPDAMRISIRLQPPSGAHWLGTDHFGRDILSMIMVGARNSLAVGAVAVGTGMVVGVPLGLAAASFGGWIDEAVGRLTDLTFAFPAILSAILITALLGPGAVNAILAIGIFNIAVFARVTRGAARQIAAREFVRAAVALGRDRRPSP